MPIDLARIIRNVVLAMASGDRISIATLPEELTTTVAASQLGVSRPTLMKMIGNGEIASHKVGSHHRLLAADVEEYKRRRLQRQREAFDKLRGLDELLEEY
ncbi:MULTISPECIES: excisionase family DNA-binding protein [Gordonia]|uniref:excisionase family DNA-binding protein n=1 Tax=Gordonia TaxID=2053 RepID=UPI0019B9563E|nr:MULTISPECIES: excisionase family DNA-binding protein [Gordonia]MBD0024227.1 excisionase family DNA-binding protein [Gordonia sp. (in: high G+C Gram-positive bacteria)]